MSEISKTKEGMTFRKALALGAIATTGLLGQSFYIEADHGHHEAERSQQMLEIYGEAALAGGMIVAGKRFNAVLDETKPR